ncbi:MULTISPECIES: DUF1905 domain-containing protein [unclassified Rathayibacter]|uniref:DUF1905 domain-containing protein n=1 Tax=unclassified Rathayibacter TaxID=2609250 RepID=UPI00188A95F0|nr:MULTISPECIES: DUF1905 domain-containing protein [unclassified Rathayibacter]MBF4461053.1 DUF1905 domain-containing protein [Rathayibacter sp. VKM Ac-2879]MBF4502464.1 DUF1905 domain-containing protein [Rathayibacter sp. VKM Ac-2878]
MPDDDANSQSKEARFSAPIIADSNSGWLSVHMPGSADYFGTGKAVKVEGTVDGHPYAATMLPVGGGVHMMPLRAAFRKVLGKGLGDQVDVQLRRDGIR